MKNIFFKLPFSFEPQLLLTDLAVCEQSEWNNHFNSGGYKGRWTTIALRSVSGNTNDVYANPQSAKFSDTPLLNHCNYFRCIIDQLQCEKESIRLLSLAPGSFILPHVDLDAGYESGLFRLHIPIKTNADVKFTVNDVAAKMEAGDCWYANFNLPHSVENNGASDRVHLVIDCKRNAWSDKLFEKIGYDFDFEKSANNTDPETIERMIAELEKMDTLVARNLIEQLKSKQNSD